MGARVGLTGRGEGRRLTHTTREEHTELGITLNAGNHDTTEPHHLLMISHLKRKNVVPDELSIVGFYDQVDHKTCPI